MSICISCIYIYIKRNTDIDVDTDVDIDISLRYSFGVVSAVALCKHLRASVHANDSRMPGGHSLGPISGRRLR